MLGTMLRERQIGEDIVLSWSTNAAANTLKRVDIPRPGAPVSEYMLAVVNPSTQTDLCARFFAREVEMGGDERLCLVRTVAIPKASSALTAWTASTAYSKGDIRHPLNVHNGHRYKVTTAGTSAAAAPVWPTTAGAKVTDGTVEWTEDGADTSGAQGVCVYLHGVFNGSGLTVVLSNDTGGTLTAFDAVLRLREVM